MTYRSIESLTYSDIQLLARKWCDTTSNANYIELPACKQQLYNILLDAGLLYIPLHPIHVCLPTDIVEHILSFGDDNMYTIFAITNRYWYERATSIWWERRYLQLGYYIPSINTCPLKLLYDSVRPRFADRLVIIRGDYHEHFGIPPSTSMEMDSSSAVLFRDSDGNYSHLKYGEIRSISVSEMVNTYEQACCLDEHGQLFFNSKSNSGDIVSERVKLDSRVKTLSNFAILTVKGKVYIRALKSSSITQMPRNSEFPNVLPINLPPIRDIYPGIITRCVTYDQKLYCLQIHSGEVNIWNIPKPQGIIVNIASLWYGTYYVMKGEVDNISELYYIGKGEYEPQKIHTEISNILFVCIIVKKTSPPSVIYASRTEMYKIDGITKKHTKYSLNLSSIISIKKHKGDIYVLGKK